jgi:hypothetical protein
MKVIIALIGIGLVLAGCPGCVKEIDINDEDVVKAAQWVASISNHGNGVDDLTIVRAAKQLVAGMNYFITIRGTIDGEMTEIEAVVYHDLKGEYHLTKVTATPITACAGCPKEISKEDARLNEVVDFLWARFALDAAKDANQAYDVSILSARVQVVAGLQFYVDVQFNYADEVAKVHAVVFMDLKQQLHPVTFEYTIHQLTTFLELVTLDTCAGCWKEIDVTDKGAIAAAHHVAQQLNSNLLPADFKLHHASVQVVAGTNYQVTFQATVDGVKTEVEAVVFRSLTGDFRVTDVFTREVVKCMGCPVAINPKGQEARSVASWAWNEVVKSNADITIVSATKQVVAGTNYFLTVIGHGPESTGTFTVSVFKGLDQSFNVIDYDIRWA